jgi:galactokinase
MSASRSALIREAFTTRFGGLPTGWVQAPGRVDLMGSHTDYNEGYVLTQAIDRNTWITFRPRLDKRVSIQSLNVSGSAEFGLDAIEYSQELPWSNYVRGVAAVFQQAGYELSGFDGLIHSTIPFGSGLSSSAALEVATGQVFNTLGNLSIDPVQMAVLCQKAENEFVGLNCGILDQYSSAMGRAGCTLLLDCRDLSSQIRPVASEIQVVICDTRAERSLTGSEYTTRRAQCEQGARLLAQYRPGLKTLRDADLALLEEHQDELPAVVVQRCRFVIEENQRVLDMSQVLEAGDRAAIQSLAQASYLGARDLYEISCHEMEQMFIAMTGAPGCIGGRQAGAGFGGCMVAFVEQGMILAFRDHVAQEYARRTGITPEIYPVAAAQGAGELNPGEFPQY